MSLHTLESQIRGFDHYKKLFEGWEATEQIIDDSKAFWMLKDPNSSVRKVCLYRDGCTMFVYGDYGQLMFTNMTWKGDPYNLHFDNWEYQMEKMDYRHRESLHVFDDSFCKDDILDWLREKLLDEYEYLFESDSGESDFDARFEGIKEFISQYGSWGYYDSYDVDDFVGKNDYYDIRNLIMFACDAFRNSDEHEWISFLRRCNFDEIGEEYDSELWSIGKRIDQRYFINMYAIRVIGEKLRAPENK